MNDAHEPATLRRVPSAVLDHVAELVEAGRLRAPLSMDGLRAANVEAIHAASFVAALGGADAAGVRAALRLLLDERAHRRPDPELVWTGPDTPRGTARDTAAIVRELFATAEETVLLAGYSFDSGRDLLKPLHGAMTTRGVKATFYLNTTAEEPTLDQARARARQLVQQFLDTNWPFGPPHPAIYYDPRTARRGPPWVSLHAKCLVVDTRRTLITSANFTTRGHDRNTEVGVLIRSRTFAEHLTAQWTAYQAECEQWPGR